MSAIKTMGSLFASERPIESGGKPRALHNLTEFRRGRISRQRFGARAACRRFSLGNQTIQQPAS